MKKIEFVEVENKSLNACGNFWIAVGAGIAAAGAGGTVAAVIVT